jgi:pimeloyl-ACP methyl ester carboxylesterase
MEDLVLHSDFTSHDYSDGDLTFEEIANNAGFSFEEHSVTTEDGYILALYRIPGLLGEEPDSEKPPVMFQHGLFSSADTWIMNYAEVAPAFVAARTGYDVWLGNNRGNTFSRKHETLDPDTDAEAFWDFTWYDMGTKDQPAFFSYIQEHTNNQKIAYIGHSEGTTQMFTALSELEDSFFGDKTSLFVALGPVSKIPNTDIKMVQLALTFYNTIVHVVEMLGMYEIMGYNQDAEMSTFCSYLPSVCAYTELYVYNRDPRLDDPDRCMVSDMHSPNGASVRQLLHYAQNIREDRF